MLQFDQFGMQKSCFFKIVDLKTGNECATRVDGEILVRGPQVSRNFYTLYEESNNQTKIAKFHNDGC